MTAPVTVYAGANCAFSDRALEFLRRKGVEPSTVHAADPAAHAEMMRRSLRASTPQIFIGERHIGGWEELAMLDSEGLLDRLLAHG